MSAKDSDRKLPNVALIGFGEVGETFARNVQWQGVKGWDILAERRAIMPGLGVALGEDCGEVLATADVILSLVTADQALDAAREYAPYLPQEAMWLDMNSVAPQTKAMAAEAVEAVNVRFVDVAIMAPVDEGLSVPMLVSGNKADEAVETLTALGFTDVRSVGSTVGRASAIKLCRSIMVKGIEALTAEMVLASSQAGVLDEVLASLDASEKPVEWAERADYNLNRMLKHGGRRAAEMIEAAEMLRAMGTSAAMSDQTVAWHEQLGGLEMTDPPETLSAKLKKIRATPEFGGE
ncbi:NAD(P)-dependent oxidoreductase [Aurantiacibacter zhengii]|uniref:NAD(P)-dependent oxidoreductase n=1 Tax=Aurantiacibacter zhengii TaxID=2307003 RepID=A0A418NTN7_9SPHN|nr:NAD(P)-dependent oxidoreductase [Aurantiacibacter zhengii]